jgi:hypothetical protein
MGRKSLRALMLAVLLLVIPGANALQMDCVPGNWYYFPHWGWKCYFLPDGGQCMICGATIVVEG